jgi:hypothetical protein
MPRHFSDLQAGTSGYLNMASDWVATGDFDIEFKFMTRIADIEIMLGTSVGASNFIACIFQALASFQHQTQSTALRIMFVGSHALAALSQPMSMVCRLEQGHRPQPSP